MKKHFLLLLLFLTFSLFLNAQINTIPKKEPLLKKSSFIVLPLFFFTPETRFGAGAASIYTFRFRGNGEETKLSQAQIGFAYTQEK